MVSVKQDYQRAHACLAVLRAEVDGALRYLHQCCSVDGALQLAALDAHQNVSYELAFCVAELDAAGHLLNYAQNSGAADKLCYELAMTYCAGNLRGVCHRLFDNAADMGGSPGQVLSAMDQAPLQDFIADFGGAERLAELGSQLLARGEVRLHSGLDQEKNMMQASFAKFAEQVVMPQAEAIHRQDLDIPDELIEAAADLGCFGTCIPQRFGGLMPDDRSDSLGMIVVTEELSRGSLCAAGSLITRPEIAARALLSGGTAEQQQRWLPQLAAGKSMAAIAITEPDYGSDVASVSLRAEPVEGGWHLNGAKTWCTFAGKADVLVTLARSHPDRSLGHRGLSMFLVEKPRFAGHEFSCESPGGGRLSGRAIPTIGYRGMHSFDLSFEDYFVPKSALLGEQAGEGRGFYAAMAGFSGGRLQTAARATGLMQAAVERAISYANNRWVFGAPVGEYQLTRVKVARMVSELTAARQFSYAVAGMMDDGQGQMESSLVKLFSCRAAERVAREAMQIHGGMGYAEESDVSRYYLDARVLSIFEGAEETLALKVIARELIAAAGRD